MTRANDVKLCNQHVLYMRRVGEDAVKWPPLELALTTAMLLVCVGFLIVHLFFLHKLLYQYGILKSATNNKDSIKRKTKP